MDARGGPAPAVTLPTGIVTLLFTDIERSTRLVQGLGSNWHRVVARHHAILRPTVHQAGGLALSTEGDSFFAVFTTPSDAVLAAVEAQRTLSVENWPERAVVRVRMGSIPGGVYEAATDTSVSMFTVQRGLPAPPGVARFCSRRRREHSSRTRFRLGSLFATSPGPCG